MSSDGDLNNMWNEATQDIANIDPAAENWKIQSLPLARVKKIMKSEEIIMQELERERLRRERAEGVADNQERSNVKFMISGEAPVLMSKACELLIKDLSFRAWQHTERNRRRTLQRQDLHAAVGESEVYDFLIDIVPRVQAGQAAPAPAAATAAPPAMNAPDMSMMQAALPPGFQVPQMAQVAANLNQATMQQAQAMAAAVPVGAPPPAAQAQLQLQQQAPAPPAPAVGSGLDPSTNPPAGIIQYSVPADALNHLVHPWDPTHLTFPPPPAPAPEGSDVPAPATANPVAGAVPAPQLHQQPAPAPVHHTQHQQPLQQPQHQLQQPQHQQVLQQLQQPQIGQQLVQHAQQQAQQQQQQVQQQPVQQQQQAQQQVQQVAQQPNHQQWMDPATIAALGSAPPAPPAPSAPAQ